MPNTRESAQQAIQNDTLAPPLAKRGRGRPKGTKNKPGAGAVGRPRKDGLPPNSRGIRAFQSTVKKYTEGLPIQNAIQTVSTPPSIPEKLNTQHQHIEPSSDLAVSEGVIGVDHVSEGVMAVDDVFEGVMALDHVPEEVLALDDENSSASQLDIDAVEELIMAAPTEDAQAISSMCSIEEEPEQCKEPSLLRCLVNPYGSDLTAAESDPQDNLDILLGLCPDEDIAFEFQSLPDDDDENILPIAPASQPIQRSTMPNWLSSHYDDLKLRLSDEIKNNPSRQPTCYDRHTFFEHGTPYFTAERMARPLPRHFYQPVFWIWVPHLLAKTRIPCPACLKNCRKGKNNTVVYIHAHGWPSSPRRITDLHSSLYLVGYRYRCVHPDCKRTFQSWSPKLLEVLPPAMSAQFTHHLTYRGGLTDDVATLMRSCFQRGIGPGPFSEMIQSFHYRHFDHLHLQYLEMIKSRKSMPLFNAMQNRGPPFGLFTDRNGYSGHIPSALYFRTFYERFMDRHAAEIDQHMAMLSARVLSIDHSHKVPGHLGKVQGSQIFNAVHTVSNEYVEIRSMLLTPTKGYNQFMPALQLIPKSLEMYGHGTIEAVYTDNLSDKNELERVFPPLKKDVVPIPDITNLPIVQIPPSWTILKLRSAFQVNTHINQLLEHLTDSRESKIFIGFDMEWSVDLDTGIQGRTALVQIAFEPYIFLIQLFSFLNDNGFLKLPHALLTLLRSNRMYKCGVNVKADLTRLYRDCGFDKDNIELPFVGGLDLRTLARTSNPMHKSSFSLAELSAVILKQHLPKDSSIRISTEWDQPELTQDQELYAARDAYTSLQIYSTFSQSDEPKSVTSDMPGGTLVSLLSRDRSTIVAKGYLSENQPMSFNGVETSKSRILVEITQVLVPAYQVPKELISTQTDQPLKVYGKVPFTLLCFTKHLQTRSNIISDSNNSSDLTQDGKNSVTDVAIDVSTESMDNLTEEPDEYNEILMNMEERNNTPWYHDIDNDQGSDEQCIETSVRDECGDICANQILSHSSGSDQALVIRSRVLGDCWHLMHQFQISMHHGLRRPFARALRDALLLPDPEDRAALQEVLKKRNMTYEKMVLQHPKYVFKRVRRFIPSPEQLFKRVAEVFTTYGPLKDAVTGIALFNDNAWNKASNILENIRRGFYSDPPGVQLYFNQRKDKDGLIIYRCCRGTNDVEGGMHRDMHKKFGSYNVAPHLAVNLLRDYCLGHNFRCGTLNRTGQTYVGHYDIWLKNRIATLLDQVANCFSSMPLYFGPGGWVNGNNYQRSNEMFGIMPLSPAAMAKYGMLPFKESYVNEQKIRHVFLAQSQGTQVAVLPLHTQTEKLIFYGLTQLVDGPFSGSRQPNWISVAHLWSGYCDGKQVFYKLPEHLKAYWKKWNEHRNEKNLIEQNHTAVQNIRELLASNSKLINFTIPVAVPQPLTQAISPPIQRPSLPLTNNWQMNNLAGTLDVSQTSINMQYYFGEGAVFQRQPNKRPVSETIAEDHPVVSRKPRTCTQCRQGSCDGRWGKDKCELLRPKTKRTKK